jgi:Septum formation
VALLAVSACSDDKKAGTPVLQTDKLGAGTCLEVPDALGEEVAKLPTIDCVKEHTHEIYSVVPWDKTKGDVFPGLDALDAYAEQVCVRDFEPYVGISTFDSTLTFTFLTPTLGSWNSSDKDRDILCVLQDSNATPLVGSMKGAKR